MPDDPDPSLSRPADAARRWEVPLLAATCALLWGSAFPGIKFVYSTWDGADTLPVRLAFAGVRFMLAGLFLMPLRGNPWRSVGRGTWRPLAALALTQTVLQYLFFYNGLAVSGGILGSLLVASGSFWWVLVAPLFLRTPPPTGRQWLGLAACAAGITLAVWRPGAGAGDPVTGGLLFLAASLSGALGAVAVARLSGRVRPTHATSLSLFAGGAVLFLCGLPGWSAFAGLLDARVAVLTIYLAAVSATAFALWNHLVQRHSANVLAGYRFLIPLAGVVESALLIPGESLGAGAVAGGTVIIAALALANRPARDRPVVRSSSRPPAAGAAFPGLPGSANDAKGMVQESNPNRSTSPMKVNDLINRSLVTAKPHDSLDTIRERMAEEGVHALPVLDEAGRAVGIVTSTDLEPDLPEETSLGDLMSDQVYTIEAGEDAREAARRMRDLGVHHLVVVDGEEAVGMLSSFDLLRVIEEG